MIDLDALAQAAACLEPLPTSVTRLAALVCDGTPELTDIVEIVQYDQALTATLLRTANSSWSASRAEVTTVKDAVVRLGTGPVLSLALAVNVRARLNHPIPEYGLAEGDLWSHSVAASLGAELVVRASNADLPPETPTAALLHDVGKLVMSRFLDAEMLEVVTRAHEEKGLTRMQAEAELLGIHHAELGGLIAQSWGLSGTLVRGILYHHDPDRGGDAIAYGVHLADVIAKAIGAGLDDNPDLEAFAHAMDALAITPDAFDEICRIADERFAEVRERFG